MALDFKKATSHMQTIIDLNMRRNTIDFNMRGNTIDFNNDNDNEIRTMK